MLLDLQDVTKHLVKRLFDLLHRLITPPIGPLMGYNGLTVPDLPQAGTKLACLVHAARSHCSHIHLQGSAMYC